MPDIEPAAPLQGIAASPGRARGPVFTVEEEAQHAGEPDLAAATSEEVAAAADLVARQLEDLAADRRDRAPDAAAILEAQALMARDPALQSAVDESLAAGRGGVAGALVDGTAGSVRWLAAGELGGVEPEAAGDGAPLDLESAPVPLMANAGSVAAVRAAAAQGLRGVGLFRTEFLFLSRSS